MFTSQVSEDQRREMIAQAAYFRAQQRGFAGGDPVADWIGAEAEVDGRLRQIEGVHVLERLEAGLATATKTLAAWKRKTSTLASGAKAEAERDVEALSGLRESLRAKVKELRAQSAQAGQSAVRQAEQVWDDLSEGLRRLGARLSH
jgi:hypothetical protein